jgi:hypothetical protein
MMGKGEILRRYAPQNDSGKTQNDKDMYFLPHPLCPPLLIKGEGKEFLKRGYAPLRLPMAGKNNQKQIEPKIIKAIHYGASVLGGVKYAQIL